VVRRTGIRYFFVAVCAASALLCAVNRVPWLSGALAVAAITLCLLSFGQPTKPNEIASLLETLKRVRDDAAESPSSIRATVTPGMIFLPVSEHRLPFLSARSVAFRDEWPAEVWREAATRLRLQPKPKPRA
jgi:hypothetical protein